MKIDRISNSQKPYFGTKVVISPKVIESFFSNEIPRFRKQINILENNGVDDVLLLFKTSNSKIGAEVYSDKGGRIVNSRYDVEEPVYAGCDYSNPNKIKRGKTVNIVKLYERAVSAICPIHITDKRYGLRVDNWQDYIPGIKK